MFDVDLALVHEFEQGGHVGRRSAIQDDKYTGAQWRSFKQVLEMFAACCQDDPVRLECYTWNKNKVNVIYLQFFIDC